MSQTTIKSNTRNNTSKKCKVTFQHNKHPHKITLKNTKPQENTTKHNKTKHYNT